MPKAVAILFGAGFTVCACLALGKLVLHTLALRFSRMEEHIFAFVVGSAGWSALVFGLAAAGQARQGVFLGAGVLVVALTVWAVRKKTVSDVMPQSRGPWDKFQLVSGAIRKASGQAESLSHPARQAIAPETEALPASTWHAAGDWGTAGFAVLCGVIFGLFTVLYFFNAMAPETSPDGSSYHLGLVARYFREHGFPRITSSMYANLSQGLEMLFLFAFAFGEHSAAALVHFAFLLSLPLAMVCYARRFGFPSAGLAGAVLVYASPLVGTDGTSAYNDVAVASILFTLFYLLQIWEQERRAALLIPIGLLAGFGYAVKYTAFLGVAYALGFVGWKLLRARQGLLRPLLVIGICAFLMMAPWLAKNWIWLGNPVSPFFNGLFPNPYVHIAFEQEYAQRMQKYDGLSSHWAIPLEATVRGEVLHGFLGPVFLLAPVGLLALRYSAGRRLLLAGLIFGLTYATNVGARFLIPSLPYVALAMAMGVMNSRGVAAALVAAHAVFSWPTIAPTYCNRYAWRLSEIPVRAALRGLREERYLAGKLSGYAVARMIESQVPPDGKVFSFNQQPDAYTSREIWVAYQAGLNNTLAGTLWTAVAGEDQPVWRLEFRFAAAEVRKLRVVQIAGPAAGEWSVSEFRVSGEGKELPRAPAWRLRAHPNPWDVQLAFDNSPVTHWRSWQSLFPGMYLELDFGSLEKVDAAWLECPRGQGEIRLKLEGELAAGQWKILAEGFQRREAPAPDGLRRAAAEELKSRGIDFLLLKDTDFLTQDVKMWPKHWGVTLLGYVNGVRLYRLD